MTNTQLTYFFARILVVASARAAVAARPVGLIATGSHWVLLMFTAVNMQKYIGLGDSYKYLKRK